MKRKAVAVLLAGALVAALFFPRSSSAGGIPVIDISNLAQSIQQVMHMLEQIEHLKSQIELAESQLSNMSGPRGMASLLRTNYDLTVTVDQDEILEDLGLKSAEENGLVGSVAELYEEGNENVALYLGQTEKSLDQAVNRFSELTKLVAKVNACPDQKDILDLQARIQAEQALLQNEAIKLSMLQAQAQAREAARKAKIRQALIESSGDNGPIDW